MINKYKARFIFKEGNSYMMIKGYLQQIEYENNPRYFLYGINNIKGIDQEVKNTLINEGISSLVKLKNTVPSFEACIVDEKARGIVKDENVVFQSFDDNGSLHISVEPWIINELRKQLEDRNLEYEKGIKEKDSDKKFGLIQPNMSQIISEIVLKHLLKGEKDYEEN